MLGLVSNCWRLQLLEGALLDALIGEAAERGFRFVELRQTCLGGFEHGDECIPDAVELARLPDQFPEVHFDLAVSLPYFSHANVIQDPLFAAAKRAACVLAGSHKPHLRLVDLNTTAEQLGQSGPRTRRRHYRGTRSRDARRRRIPLD